MNLDIDPAYEAKFALAYDETIDEHIERRISEGIEKRLREEPIAKFKRDILKSMQIPSGFMDLPPESNFAPWRQTKVKPVKTKKWEW